MISIGIMKNLNIVKKKRIDLIHIDSLVGEDNSLISSDSISKVKINNSAYDISNNSVSLNNSNYRTNDSLNN